VKIGLDDGREDLGRVDQGRKRCSQKSNGFLVQLVACYMFVSIYMYTTLKLARLTFRAALFETRNQAREHKHNDLCQLEKLINVFRQVLLASSSKIRQPERFDQIVAVLTAGLA